jgi:hypothetical protein
LTGTHRPIVAEEAFILAISSAMSFTLGLEFMSSINDDVTLFQLKSDVSHRKSVDFGRLDHLLAFKLCLFRSYC